MVMYDCMGVWYCMDVWQYNMGVDKCGHCMGVYGSNTSTVWLYDCCMDVRVVWVSPGCMGMYGMPKPVGVVWLYGIPSHSMSKE